jgi:hypothetical protein
MAAAATKGFTVVFNGAVNHGFKHDTPGHESTLDRDGKAVSSTREFFEGETFEVPGEEAAEFEALVALGLCTKA